MPQNIREIKFSDKDFPKILKEIPSPPKKFSIWSKSGKLPEAERFLSIVGTRRCSAYGEEILRKLIADLTPYGFGTVSGMAIGIDTIAAKASLENKIPTIAVLGSGLGREAFYPPRNWRLAEEIVAFGGAIISEYENDFKATLWTFPQRNRIISGLSPVTLVVEAPEKSGALITARFALEQNRDVLAIPGSVFGSNSAGTNKLIKEGAGLVTNVDDILKAYGLISDTDAPGGRVADFDLSPVENKILELMTGPMDVDSIIRAGQMPSHETQSIIGLLEIRGIIKKIGSDYVKIKN